LALGYSVLGPVVPLTLLAWPCLLLLALRLPIFASRPAMWLGDRSYAIYLLHIIFVDLVYHGNNGGLAPTVANVIVAHVGLVVVTLIVADIAYRRLEKPSRDALRRWWGRRSMRLAVA
jgi:peptidoglycan/LPS O-acetylase OafA/YrhL